VRAECVLTAECVFVALTVTSGRWQLTLTRPISTHPTESPPGGGTPHKPPIIGPNGHVLHESTSCADYLIQARGAASGDLLKETSSYDTVG
jgi:hypothetical protein